MGELQGIARFTFKEGMVNEYKRLTDECMEIVRTQEPDTLQYEIFLSEDESSCVVLERYKDSAAGLLHLEHVAHLMEPIMATVASSEGELLGEPSDELRKKMAGSGVRLLKPYLAM